jgi:hypothetical protein
MDCDSPACRRAAPKHAERLPLEIRLGQHLVNATSRHTRWAERFDGGIGDMATWRQGQQGEQGLKPSRDRPEMSSSASMWARRPPQCPVSPVSGPFAGFFRSLASPTSRSRQVRCLEARVRQRLLMAAGRPREDATQWMLHLAQQSSKTQSQVRTALLPASGALRAPARDPNRTSDRQD